MPAIHDFKTTKRYSLARMSRDARFDGLFFTAVKTTQIYCRPICPATPPKEQNVEYHATAISAASAGFRPCLRCRPDSAPNSHAWQGTDAVFKRAVTLIQQGALQNQSLESLSERLGISSRHLRSLFQEKLGTSPKKYALYQQCLFAKQLLHDTGLAITDIAFAAGFNSVRRFNEVMVERLQLSPTQIRKQHPSAVEGCRINLRLHYRPPFEWALLLDFLRRRKIDGLEWCSDQSYGRTFEYTNHQHAVQCNTRGWFELKDVNEKSYLELTLSVNDIKKIHQIVQRIRQIFDLDAPIAEIDKQLQLVFSRCGTRLPNGYQEGLRIPGVWAGFEAGVRGILGQQVSVKQAHNLVTTLVRELGEKAEGPGRDSQFYFPTPEAVVNSELTFFRMPQARKDTLRRLAKHVLSSSDPDNYDAWLTLKGIGPWTVNYVKLRAEKAPDVWLAGDAGVKNALKRLDHDVDIGAAQPWRSYLVFHLWNQL